MRQHTPSTLSYDTQPPRPWINPRRLRQLITAVVLIALAVRYGPTTVDLVEAEYHEYQWGQYHPAPHTIVMDMSPPTILQPATLEKPAVLRQSVAFAPLPPEWYRFPRNYFGQGALFLGRRTSPNGTPYWINLDFSFGEWGHDDFGMFSDIKIEGGTASTGSFFHPSEVVWSGDGWHVLRINPNCQGLFRFYAGQPDPANPSRFTIDYTYNGKPGTIDGQVLDTGVIVLTPRTGVVVKRSGVPTWSPIPTPWPPNVP